MKDREMIIAVHRFCKHMLRADYEVLISEEEEPSSEEVNYCAKKCFELFEKGYEYVRPHRSRSNISVEGKTKEEIMEMFVLNEGKLPLDYWTKNQILNRFRTKYFDLGDPDNQKKQERSKENSEIVFIEASILDTFELDDQSYFKRYKEPTRYKMEFPRSVFQNVFEYVARKYGHDYDTIKRTISELTLIDKDEIKSINVFKIY